MPTRKPLGPVGKAVTAVATALVLGLALMFSVVVLSLLVGIGVIAWIYLRWKWRHAPRQSRRKGNVFEGEAEVVTTDPADPPAVPPGELPATRSGRG